MSSHSSSTTDDTSEVGNRVIDAVTREVVGRSSADNKKIGELITRIRDLELRGFIRRQKYRSPTSIEFERSVQLSKRATGFQSRVNSGRP